MVRQKLTLALTLTVILNMIIYCCRICCVELTSSFYPKHQLACCFLSSTQNLQLTYFPHQIDYCICAAYIVFIVLSVRRCEHRLSGATVSCSDDDDSQSLDRFYQEHATETNLAKLEAADLCVLVLRQCSQSSTSVSFWMLNCQRCSG